MSSVALSFFSVGHGLYHAGKFIKNSELAYNQTSFGSAFTYIYDCGSMQFSSSCNRYMNVEDSIDASLSFYKDLKKIDVLFVSHFHKDHVNKLKYLISKLERRGITFDRLVVPYVDIYKRLLMYLEYESGQNQPSIENVSKINKEYSQNKSDCSVEDLSGNDEHESKYENNSYEDKNLDDDSFNYPEFIVNPYSELLVFFKKSTPKISILKNPTLYAVSTDNDQLIEERKRKKSKSLYRLKRSLRSKDDMSFILSNNSCVLEFDELDISYCDIRKIHVFLPPIRSQRTYSKVFFSEFKKIVSSVNSIEELFIGKKIKQLRQVYQRLNLINKTSNDVNLTSLLVFHYSQDQNLLKVQHNAVLLLGDTNLGHTLSLNNKAKFSVADYIIKHLGIMNLSSIRFLLIPHHGSRNSWSNDIMKNLRLTLCVVSGSIKNDKTPNQVVFDAFKSNRDIAQDLYELLAIIKICNAPEIVHKNDCDANGNYLLWVNENYSLDYCFVCC